MDRAPASPPTIVVPTVGRPSLAGLVEALAGGHGPAPAEVARVTARPGPPPALERPAPPWPMRVVRWGGRGPAAARNTGWRSALSPWIAFFDDDVLPPADWLARLADDLDQAEDDVVGSQGRIAVPAPEQPVGDDR